MQIKNNFILNQQIALPIKNHLIFSQNQNPNQRYIFMKILGKGGFEMYLYIMIIYQKEKLL